MIIPSYITDYWGIPDAKYYLWQVLDHAGYVPTTPKRPPEPKFLCLCDCGNCRVVRFGALLDGTSRNCGSSAHKKKSTSPSLGELRSQLGGIKDVSGVAK